MSETNIHNPAGRHTQQSKLLYFDCYSGISGDMILAALLDSGVQLKSFLELLGGLRLGGYRLKAEKVIRYGICGTNVEVQLDSSDRVHRHLPQITALIGDSALPGPVKDKSIAVFKNLAGAEAAVHGISVDKVHFHEVGAVDAIVDIVGCVVLLHLLSVDKVCCSPLPLGRGMVQAAHGTLPLPAPATLELLKRHRVPVYGRNTEMELVTPTGAALLTTLAGTFGPPPAFTLQDVGYGAGKLDPGYPNFLRVFIGAVEDDPPVDNVNLLEDQVWLIEANIDDLNPEIYGYLMERLFEEGALDVYFTPIQMKKNRPAVKLAVLASPEKFTFLTEIVFRETSTLGLRVTEARKIMKRREVETVDTQWGPVRVKLVPPAPGEQLQHYAPEHEDCLAIARRTGLPLKEVYRLVESRFRQTRGL